jgi:hypothetical protein
MKIMAQSREFRAAVICFISFLLVGIIGSLIIGLLFAVGAMFIYGKNELFFWGVFWMGTLSFGAIAIVWAVVEGVSMYRFVVALTALRASNSKRLS